MGNENTGKSRLELLFDGGSFNEIGRLAGTKGAEESVTAATGYVGGAPVVAFSQNAGAMGKADMAKIKKVYELAEKIGAPIVGIYDAQGVYVCEGAEMLAAYGDIIASAGRVSGVVPQISVVAGVCVGSSAVLASLADVVVMTADAELCFSSAKLCGDKEEKVGTAEAAAANGTAAIVCDDVDAAVKTVAELLLMLPANNLSATSVADYVPSAAAVKNGCSAEELATAICDADSIMELYAEHGKKALTAFARVGGYVVGVVATRCNVICSTCSKKIARFVRLCDAFSIPVVTVIDSEGVKVNKDFELSGGMKGIAVLTHAYAEATVGKIAVICNNAVGAAAMAMAGGNADAVFAVEGSVVSALKVSAAVQLLYGERLAAGENRADLEKEYAENEGSAAKAAEVGYVDDVVAADAVASKVLAALEMLSSKRVSTLDKKHSNMPF